MLTTLANKPKMKLELTEKAQPIIKIAIQLHSLMMSLLISI